MKALSAREFVIIIGYDDEFGDAHFYTAVGNVRDLTDHADCTAEGLIKNIIEEVGFKNVFLKRWIYENIVQDF